MLGYQKSFLAKENKKIFFFSSLFFGPLCFLLVETKKARIFLLCARKFFLCKEGKFFFFFVISERCVCFFVVLRTAVPIWRHGNGTGTKDDLVLPMKTLISGRNQTKLLTISRFDRASDSVATTPRYWKYHQIGKHGWWDALQQLTKEEIEECEELTGKTPKVLVLFNGRWEKQFVYSGAAG